MTISLSPPIASAGAAGAFEAAPGTAQPFATTTLMPIGMARFLDTLQRTADSALLQPSAPVDGDAALPDMAVPATLAFDGFDDELRSNAAPLLSIGTMTVLAMPQPTEAIEAALPVSRRGQQPSDRTLAAVTTIAERASDAGTLIGSAATQTMHMRAQTSQSPAALQAPLANATQSASSDNATLGPETGAMREKGMVTTLWLREASAGQSHVPSHADNATATDLSARAAPKTEAGTSRTLLETLGERINWQLKRGSERAVIRLDPPMQGQLEINIRREGAGIQVHLSATSSEVVRQLQSIGDSLRQDLVGRQAGEVAVLISLSARDSDGRERHKDNAPDQNLPGQALAEAEVEQDPARFALHPTPY